MQWLIGDWYNAIKWNDKQKACDKAGLSFNTAKQFGYVCNAFKFGARAPISFRHHLVLSADDLTDNQRIKLLKQAETDKWSSGELKKQRDIELGRWVEPVKDDSSLEDAVKSATTGVPAEPDRRW